jgi:hypothetical protein
VTVADRFEGAAINPAVWDQFKNGDGWTLAQRGGQLEFNFLPGTIPGGATNTYGGELATHCKFSGDFDARVSYDLAAWPPANGVTVSLWAFFAPVFAPSDYAWRAWRWSTAQAEQYGSYTGPGLTATYAVADSSGELRLARRHGTVTTYFKHNGNWVALTSGTDTNLAAIAIGAASEPGGTFGGQQVLVDLDNFQVTAAKSVC